MARSDDHRDAHRLASEAGDLLLELRRGIGSKYSADEAKALGDRNSQELLAEALAKLHPGDAVLSEEAEDDDIRLTASRVWIIDPLDGTREFGEPPRVDWAVHVALVVNGSLVVGAVALPAQGRVISTLEPPALTPPPGRHPRMVVSRSRPPAWTEAVAAALDAEVIPMGSAGAKIAAVVLGEVDLYVHAGGQHEWDSAAPVAVAEAVGLHASRVDGSPLRYNQPDAWLPDLAVCHPAISDRVLAALAVAL